MSEVQQSDRKQRRSPAEVREIFERTGVDQTVDTGEAAELLRVRAQTLRRWSCQGTGPIRARRVNGRLRWSVADIRAVLSGAADQPSAA